VHPFPLVSKATRLIIVVSTLDLVFEASRMAANAVPKVQDTLLNVFVLDLGRIVFMTAVAGIAGHLIGMAGTAGTCAGSAMVERELMHLIKKRRQPADGSVAVCTVDAKGTLMKARFRVAPHATPGCLAQNSVNVTRFTRDIDVGTRQRKGRYRMIDGRLMPILWRMALLAHGTQPSVMGIVIPVATNAIGPSVPESPSKMTFFTFQTDVSADQRKGG
jgi:hypothetical protein